MPDAARIGGVTAAGCRPPGSPRARHRDVLASDARDQRPRSCRRRRPRIGSNMSTGGTPSSRSRWRSSTEASPRPTVPASGWPGTRPGCAAWKRSRSARRRGRRQPPLLDAADHREGRVEHVADLVAHHLPHQMRRPGRRQPVIRRQPRRHLGRRMLQRLVQRPGVADREDAVRRLAARPGDRPALLDGQPQRHRRSRSRPRCRRSRRRPAPRGSRRERTARPARRPGSSRVQPARSRASPCCRRCGRSTRWRSPARRAAPPRSSRSSAPAAAAAARARPPAAPAARCRRRGRSATRPGRAAAGRAPPRRSTTFAASAARVQPVSRTGSTVRISTRSASPGSAPSTKTGPFIGFGGTARLRPDASTPAASSVSVTSVSPLLTRSAGGIAARTFGQADGSRRCSPMAGSLPLTFAGPVKTRAWNVHAMCMDCASFFQAPRRR